MRTAMFSRLFFTEGMVPTSMRLKPFPTAEEAVQRTLKISIPAIIELLLISATSAVDTMMVGQLGKTAISAVGVCGQIRLMLLCFNRALNVGVMAVTSRRKGENNREKVNDCLKQALLISFLLDMAIFGFGIYLLEPLLKLYGAKGEVFSLAKDYLRIVCVGSFLYSLCLTINATLRGIGNTKITLRTNLAANVVNLLLNYILITGRLGAPRLEVTGAAIATAGGNLVALIMALSSVWSSKKYMTICYPCSWRLTRDISGSMLKVAYSSMVEQVTLQFGKALCSRMILSTGVINYAANIIAGTFFEVSFSISDGYGNGASSLVGQSLGAKRRDCAIISVKTGQRMAFLTISIYVFFLIVFRKLIVSLYASEAPVIELTYKLLFFLVPASLFQSTQAVLAGSLRGSGDSGYVAAQSLLGIAILRPILTYIFAILFHMGAIGIWLATAIDQFLRATLLIIRFKSNKWMEIRI